MPEFVLPLLWIGGLLIASALYRRGNGKPIIPRTPPDAAFHESWCSGRSLRNWLTRIGGARNCLLVYVQKDELVVTPHFPFTLLFLPEIYGLDVRVPLTSVASVDPSETLFGQVVRIAFIEGGPAAIELKLRDRNGLAHHLGRLAAVGNDRTWPPASKRRKSWRLVAFRVFAAIWGIGVLFAAFSSLPDDYRYRRDRIEVTGVFDSEFSAYPGSKAIGVLSYSVGDQRYHLKSLWSTGSYKMGETEQLFYLPADPAHAREADYLRFDLMWLSLGILALTASIFSGKVARLLS